jgi:hypothetical protein
MTFPPSKIGDKYNYEIATYLKLIGLPDLGPQYDLKSASINPSPKVIPSSYTLFETNVSFDIIASTASWELFIECKHSEFPEPMKKKSPQFLESIVEFLSVIPLKNLEYKEYKYILISNMDTKQLITDLQELRISSDLDLTEFLEIIKNTARKKWKNVNINKVTIRDLRSCLNDLRVLTIDDGTLEAMRDNTKFQEIFNKFYSEVGKRLPDLPPDIPTSTKLLFKYGDDDFMNLRWHSYPISISKNFVKWILAQNNKKSDIIEIPFESIPQCDKIVLNHVSELSGDQVEIALSSLINDFLQKNDSSIAIVISPGKKRLYIFNPQWLCDKTSQLRENNYSINLNKIQEILLLPFGGTLLKLAIQESYRITKGILYDSAYFFD